MQITTDLLIQFRPHSRGCLGRDGRRALEDDHTISQVRGHDEIVFHNKRRLLSVQDKPTTYMKTLAPKPPYGRQQNINLLTF